MGESDQEERSLKELRAGIWEKTKNVTLARITTLEQALASSARGLLTVEQRAMAAGEAHKLAGSLGTFGFLEAGQLARQIELILKQAGELHPNEGRHLTELLLQLRQQINDSEGNLRGNS